MNYLALNDKYRRGSIHVRNMQATLIEHVTHGAIVAMCTSRTLLYMHSLVLCTTRKMCTNSLSVYNIVSATVGVHNTSMSVLGQSCRYTRLCENRTIMLANIRPVT